ncbi:hypothetical protein O181_062524 [Austropuccinia psidii MF-1]|uniref:Uncharacterized protein n=1 Tax=Austropuccinia psidii MF-1 TaxID=1389203 RepID=A0A9Q3EKA5_9BASI|nr:hypothetical protein [Austropuccinia psidii MF-1]
MSYRSSSQNAHRYASTEASDHTRSMQKRFPDTCDSQSHMSSYYPIKDYSRTTRDYPQARHASFETWSQVERGRDNVHSYESNVLTDSSYHTRLGYSGARHDQSVTGGRIESEALYKLQLSAGASGLIKIMKQLYLKGFQVAKLLTCLTKTLIAYWNENNQRSFSRQFDDTSNTRMTTNSSYPQRQENDSVVSMYSEMTKNQQDPQRQENDSALPVYSKMTFHVTNNREAHNHTQKTDPVSFSHNQVFYHQDQRVPPREAYYEMPSFQGNALTVDNGGGLRELETSRDASLSHYTGENWQSPSFPNFQSDNRSYRERSHSHNFRSEYVAESNSSTVNPRHDAYSQLPQDDFYHQGSQAQNAELSRDLGSQAEYRTPSLRSTSVSDQWRPEGSYNRQGHNFTYDNRRNEKVISCSTQKRRDQSSNSSWRYGISSASKKNQAFLNRREIPGGRKQHTGHLSPRKWGGRTRAYQPRLHSSQAEQMSCQTDCLKQGNVQKASEKRYHSSAPNRAENRHSRPSHYSR